MMWKAIYPPALCIMVSVMAFGADGAKPELTPTGANALGNAAGTIPPWTGGLPKNPLGANGELSDPFAADERLFTVTATDPGPYAENLTPGQRAMLERHPESYTIPVFRSRRSASYPEFVYQALENNRSSARLVSKDGRQGVVNASIASPFPRPGNGLEAIWNHLMRWRGILLERQTSWVPVTSSGRYRPLLLFEEIAFPYASPAYTTTVTEADGSLTQVPEYRRAMIAIKKKFVSPGRVSGNGSLVYETYDYINYERIRWIYSASLKRVVRLPRSQLDQPIANADGIISLDDLDMFRGSTELFDWELDPPTEMLVPYNAYRLIDRELRFEDLIARHHLNQDLTRYELHRVWRVTATAKPDRRSTYSKRVFYLDEDTWQIVLSEKYDRDGNLAMYAEAHSLNHYNIPVTISEVSTHYRLDDGRFLVQGISNMLQPYSWHEDINPRNFSPNALLDYIR